MSPIFHYMRFTGAVDAVTAKTRLFRLPDPGFRRTVLMVPAPAVSFPLEGTRRGSRPTEF